jgi:hypothetical protein
MKAAPRGRLHAELQPDPARELTTYFQSGSTSQIDYGIPGLQDFISDGWIVVATDYQGLGTEGVHQYTVNRTNGIDAVAMSPGVPIIGLQQPGLGTALAGDGPIPPDGHLFMILCGMAAAFPDTLSLDDVLTPVGKRVFEDSWNTAPVHHLSDILGRAFKHEGAVMAINTEKFPAWGAAFKASSATLNKPVCPVLVLIDRQDPNGPCPVPWQLGYIEAIKALGGDISSSDYPDDDHFSLPQSSVGQARAWLTSKF